MPCWSIHLSIAKRVNKELNFNKNIFYFANIIPDTERDSILNRYDSHYYGTFICEGCPEEKLPDLERFLNDYGSNLKDPLVCGYYCHLLSDYYYNNEVYTKYFVQNNQNKIIGIKLLNGKTRAIENDYDGKIRANYKHRDFETYGKKLCKNNEFEYPIYDESILNSIGKLKIEFLNEEIIKRIIEKMKINMDKWNKESICEKIFGLKYYMINEKNLDILYENCIKFILDELHKHKVIL